MIPFGKAIRNARKRAKVSQTALAELIGWEKGQTRISNYENGVREPTQNDLSLIADALGMTLSELIVEVCEPQAVAEEPKPYCNSPPTPKNINPELADLIEHYDKLPRSSQFNVMAAFHKELENWELKHSGTVDGDSGRAHA